MRRGHVAAVFFAVVAATAAAALLADVKTQEKTQIKFEGTLGRMVGLFGGKTAKEGVVSTVAVKGDRKARLSDDGGQIIDLAEEKVYELNTKDKTYKVVTFAELRKQLEEAQKKAAEQMKEAEGRQAEQPQQELEMEFDVRETGQTRTIAGHNCREVIMTVTLHEKGKKLEEAGGFVMTADAWMAPQIPEMKEIVDFDLRFAKKIGFDAAAAGQQLAAVFAMYPGLTKAQAKLREQQGTMDGTPMLTTVTFDSVPNPQAAAQASKEEPAPSGGGIGGMLGGLGRRVAKKKPEEGGQTKGRSTVMTSTTEILSVGTAVAAADVAIPAGFRQK